MSVAMVGGMRNNFCCCCLMFDAPMRKLIESQMQFTVVFVQKMHVEFGVNILASTYCAKELEEINSFSTIFSHSYHINIFRFGGATLLGIL
jgi:hypothetical protein